MSTNARMASTELTYTDLSGLDFRGCNMQLCSFAGADMRGALWDDARGELFDELAGLRERAETFDEVDAERANKLEDERDEARNALVDAELERDEARAHAEDLEARLADVERVP